MQSNEAVSIHVELREPGSSNQAKRLRREGKLPAVLYGGGREPRTIVVDPKDVVRILKSDSGQNTLLNLQVGEGRKQPALIHDYQVDPITHRILHADFLRIDLKAELEVEVPIEVVGEARGVKVDHGILEIIQREVTVRCLPTDIPDHIPVDVSALGIGDAVHLSDLPAPEGVQILGDPEQAIVIVAAPAVAVEAEAAAEEEEGLIAPAAEPEVIGKGGAAEESGEEG